MNEANDAMMNEKLANAQTKEQFEATLKEELECEFIYQEKSGTDAGQYFCHYQG